MDITSFSFIMKHKLYYKLPLSTPLCKAAVTDATTATPECCTLS